MGSHIDCKDWDYETHPQRAEITTRCSHLRAWLIKRPRRFDRYSYDTRPGHRFIFTGFAPAACSCIAGAYRGTVGCAALTGYKVAVPADPKVGTEPFLVPLAMKTHELLCKQACDAFIASQSQQTVNPAVALVRFAEILCDLLEMFLAVHPYANGNGHAARLLVCALITRHGFVPTTWPIDNRPPYGPALFKYRRGEKKPLIKLMIASMRAA